MRRDDIDGNSAALIQHERREERLDREQAMIEEAARGGQQFYLNNLDHDDIQEAFAGMTSDELDSLCEDCGGPMRDAAHAGSIVLGAVERFCFQRAIKDEQEA
jgi:hypothetical protein